MASAMIETPPSPRKLELIRRFLRLNGNQVEIDNGRFLDRLVMLGSPLMTALPAETALGHALDLMKKAVEVAYEPRRHFWQEEYETHVNWEFTEAELEEMTAFLGGAIGQHFLEGRWRMGAYIGTNTEGLVEEIFEEARAALSQSAPT